MTIPRAGPRQQPTRTSSHPTPRGAGAHTRGHRTPCPCSAHVPPTPGPGTERTQLEARPALRCAGPGVAATWALGCHWREHCGPGTRASLERGAWTQVAASCGAPGSLTRGEGGAALRSPRSAARAGGLVVLCTAGPCARRPASEGACAHPAGSSAPRGSPPHTPPALPGDGGACALSWAAETRRHGARIRTSTFRLSSAGEDAGRGAAGTPRLWGGLAPGANPRGKDRTGARTEARLPGFWELPAPQSERHGAGILARSLKKLGDPQGLIRD